MVSHDKYNFILTSNTRNIIKYIGFLLLFVGMVLIALGYILPKITFFNPTSPAVNSSSVIQTVVIHDLSDQLILSFMTPDSTNPNDININAYNSFREQAIIKSVPAKNKIDVQKNNIHKNNVVSVNHNSIVPVNHNVAVVNHNVAVSVNVANKNAIITDNQKLSIVHRKVVLKSHLNMPSLTNSPKNIPLSSDGFFIQAHSLAVSEPGFDSKKNKIEVFKVNPNTIQVQVSNIQHPTTSPLEIVTLKIKNGKLEIANKIGSLKSQSSDTPANITTTKSPSSPSISPTTEPTTSSEVPPIPNNKSEQ